MTERPAALSDSTDSSTTGWPGHIANGAVWLLAVAVVASGAETLLGRTDLSSLLLRGFAVASFSCLALALVADLIKARVTLTSTWQTWVRWGCASALLAAGALPLVLKVPHISGGTWLLSHGLGALLISCAPLINGRTIMRILFALSTLSFATILLGTTALAPDERSLFGLSGRLIGVFGHPNVTGFAATLYLLFALLMRRRWWHIVAALAVLLLALSLTSLAALVAGLGAAALHRRWIRIASGVAVMAATFAPAVVAWSAPRFLSPEAFTTRGEIWLWTADYLRNNKSPQGPSFYLDLAATQSLPTAWTHAHNQVLMDLVTGGGTQVFLTWLISAGIGIAAIASRRALPFAAWVAITVTSALEVPYLVDYPGARVLLLAAVSVAVWGPCSVVPSRVVLSTRERIWGGGETFLHHLAPELRKLGRRVRWRVPVDSELAMRARGTVMRRLYPSFNCVIVANDFRSVWQSLLIDRLAERIFIVHGEWQLSRLRAVILSLSHTSILCVNAQLVTQCRHFGIRDAVVLPIGPPAARTHPHTEHPIVPTDGIVRVGIVSRLDPVKRLDLFARTLDELGDGYTGVVVCPPPVSPEEAAMVENLASHERIVIHPDGDASHVWNDCGVFLSTSADESFGLAHLEALQHHLVVLTTAKQGPREYLNGVLAAGLLDDRHDLAEQVRRALQKIHTSKAEYAAAGREAAAHRGPQQCAATILGRAA